MSLTTNELLTAVADAYGGASVVRSGPRSFVVDAMPARELVFSFPYFEMFIESSTAYTVEQLVEDIQKIKELR